MILAALALLVVQALPAAIPNPGFEQGLEGWTASGHRGFRAGVGSNYAATPGQRWLTAGWAARSRAPDGATFRVGTRIDARLYRGRRIRISALTRIGGGRGGAAVLFAASGAALARTPLRFGDDWQRQSLVLAVPRRAREISLGFDLTSPIGLEADDVRLEVLR